MEAFDDARLAVVEPDGLKATARPGFKHHLSYELPSLSGCRVLDVEFHTSNVGSDARSQERNPGAAQLLLTADYRHGVFDFAHAIHSSATASCSWANRDISFFVIIA